MSGQIDVERTVGLIAQSISLLQMERTDDALQCLNQALEIAPDFPLTLVKRGAVLQRMARHRDAIADFDRCLALTPDLAHVVAMRDTALQAALATLEDDLSQTPVQVTVLYERADLLLRLTRDADALSAFQQVLECDACHAGALNAMGNLLLRMSRFDDALACYERILEFAPDDVVALVNRGNVLQQNGRYGDALASYDAALAVRPGFAEALIEQAHCHLALGDMQAGWTLYEARWGTEQMREQLRRARLQSMAPMWRGDALGESNVLLLWAEQGLGDTLQFVRYLPMVAQRAPRIVLRVQGALKSLFCCFAEHIAATCATTISVIGNDQALSPHDWHCPLMSLPMIFGSDLQSLPADVPYLQAPESSIAKWRTRLGAGGKLRIGLVWAGVRHMLNNSTRDVPLRMLLPLLELDAEWFSLQQSISDADAALLARLPQVRSVGDELTDLADTAGLVTQLDLIVSVDSSVAHLAGALGKPVWLMLRKSGEWRWLPGRDDSPWYPLHCIFRQQHHGEWESVVHEMIQQFSLFSRPDQRD